MFSFDKKTRFALKDIDEGHHKVTYKGVPAIKCPFDYVIYQMIVFEVQPDLIIEIGTNAGGSSLYLADLLELNKKGELHTIDLPGNTEHHSLHSHSRIRLFKNGFENYDTAELSKFKTILVIEDGSHTYEDSLAALKKLSPFVSHGSYYIVEDGIIDNLGRKKEYNGGPVRAIEEFLSINEEFSIERRWCDFFGKNSTFNISGYLKRNEN
jgi:cephalosporin hydroxylase